MLILLLFLANLLLFAQSRPESNIIEVVAPELRVDPTLTEDFHLCYSVKVPEGDNVYATSFVPTFGAIVAHHLKLYSCVPGVLTESIWACGSEPFNVTQYVGGGVCQEEENILYVWAKNASRLDLPKDVGFELKGGSHLVLGLHYKGMSSLPKEVTPGINVIVTKKRPSKIAKVFMMHSSKNDIQPHTTEFWDMECPVGAGITPFHPFAFRTHAHNLGRGILGYKIDGKTKEWTLIGSGDPMLPQEFYPTQTDGYIQVNPGDTLAARCIMVNDLDHEVRTGAKDSDEMCVYYIMYYIESFGAEITSDQVMKKCKSMNKRGRWENWFKNVPANADTFNGITYHETYPDKFKNEMKSDHNVFSLIAPELRVDPKKVEDVQLCYVAKIPDGDASYAVGFEPTEGAMIVAHHMRIFTCAPGVREDTVWVCGPEGNPFPEAYPWGPPCSTQEKTIYIWAKNASKLELPEDVGFHLPGGSHVVLNLHYKDVGHIPKEIVPGVNMILTKTKPSKFAGVFQLVNDHNQITPNSTEFWDVGCQIEDGIIPFYPFAFRVHAHHLGRAIMGYVVDGETNKWTRIGIMDPMLPHAFYPVQTDGYIKIQAGDKLASRCIMVNDQSKIIQTGPTDYDEMCIFYVMYYVETEEQPQSSQVMSECVSLEKRGRWTNWFEDIPEDSSQYNGITYKESKTVSEFENDMQSDRNVLSLIAPELRVDPKKVEDIQLCYVAKIPDGNASYAVGFEPTEGAMIVAHHMRIFTCAPGVREDTVWVCGPEGNPFPDAYPWGPPCSTEEKTIYVWAKNASKLELPNDVGFHLPGGSHVVLALHYKDVGHIPKEIVPGINMILTKTKPSKLAGVFQLINDYNQITPNTTEFWDVGCQIEDGILPFYPFAFRVHAHHLGRAIMGYVVDGETNKWTRIGIMDPMLPHAFYPVQTDGYVKIQAGDKLASRCIMVNDQSKSIRTGPTDHDEMCIFYVMYYVETKEQLQSSQVMNECLSLGKKGRWTNFFEDIPEDSSQYNGITYKETKTVSNVIDVIAPPLRVSPEKTQDLNLCYSVQVPEGDTVYAVAFDPIPGAIVAHHMKLFSCAPGVRTDTIWSCGPEEFNTPEYDYGLPCMTEEKMLYVWAKNATRLDLPEDVGFHLQGGSHMVLALHYKGISDLPADVTPGVKVIVTDKKPAKKAGVFMMVNSHDSIPPHTTEFWDVSCQVPDALRPFYPFAFRTHSHHLGRGIMGYKVDGASKKWTLIGKYDPMQPQAFYPSPMNGSVAVYPGDMLASRCIMVNDQSDEIYTGPTDADEMCIFYIMYYTKSVEDDEKEMHDCASSGKMGRWNNWFENIPQGTDEYDGTKYHESLAKKNAISEDDPEKLQKLFMKK